MSTYTPEYISQVMSFVSGDIVTADEFNTILNKVIHQGDHNSEWLNYLDTVGIPAAVAEITGEDIEEYIQEEVEEEIQALTASSASRTTGYTKTKDCVIINTTQESAVLQQDFAGINNLWTPSTTALPPYNPIPTGYSGSDITAMTSENRASDCTSLRNAINNIVSLDIMPYIYQSKTSTDGIAPSYMYGNIAAYLYKVTSIVDYDTVRTKQESGHPMQFPVCEVSNVDAVTAALANATIDSCCIVAAPIGDATYAAQAALRTALVNAGFNIITFKDFLTKWLKNLYSGSTVYATQLSEGRRQHYSNVLTEKIRFAVDKADGTAALFDYTDILKLSEDKLTFTNNNGSLVVTNAAGQTVITYTPTSAVIDNTLVGNTPSTSELPVVVTTSGSGSGQSFVNNTFKVGNGVAKINNKNIPWVQSYNSTTGVLVFGGL